MHRVQVACGCNKNAACPTPTRRLPHTPQQPILYKPKSPQPRNGANPPRLTAQRGSTRLKAHAPGTLRTSTQRDNTRQSVKNKRSTTPYSICNLDGADFARAWATVHMQRQHQTKRKANKRSTMPTSASTQAALTLPARGSLCTRSGSQAKRKQTKEAPPTSTCNSAGTVTLPALGSLNTHGNDNRQSESKHKKRTNLDPTQPAFTLPAPRSFLCTRRNEKHFNLDLCTRRNEKLVNLDL
jgi:hypothetical protein